MHHDLKDLDWSDVGNGWTRAVVELKKGDTAVNPASTKPERVLRGPALVIYDRHRTSIQVTLEDPPVAPSWARLMRDDDEWTVRTALSCIASDLEKVADTADGAGIVNPALRQSAERYRQALARIELADA